MTPVGGRETGNPPERNRKTSLPEFESFGYAVGMSSRGWTFRFVLRMGLFLTAGPMSCSPAPQDHSGLPNIQVDLSPACPTAVPNGARPAPETAPKVWMVDSHRPWRYIVIHHSAIATGNADEYDALHRKRGWDELGYHFVICNGQGGPDGAVQVGPRWVKQKWGAHTGGTPGNAYNNYGIGICLVGDLRQTEPTDAQKAALRDLLNVLMLRHDVCPENVLTHREAPNAETDCPGDAFQAWIDSSLRPALRSSYASR
jgi:hypothetical protein